MPDALRTAVPCADWRSIPVTCDVSGGMCGIRDALALDVVGARVSYLWLIVNTVGALLEQLDFGDEGVLIYHAEKILVPKDVATGSAFVVGQRVYYDPATRLVYNAWVSGFLWIGICVRAAADDDLRVMIDLKGDKASANL